MQSSKIIGILIEDARIEHHTESAYVIEQEMTALGYTCITLSTGRKDEKKGGLHPHPGTAESRWCHSHGFYV